VTVRRTLRAVAALLALAGCTPTPPSPPPLFTLLPPDSTGVRFANTLPERPEFNILNYLYYYNGGGVAVGDVDGDGRQDLYFSANLGPTACTGTSAASASRTSPTAPASPGRRGGRRASRWPT
jgi:hypothetical protein